MPLLKIVKIEKTVMINPTVLMDLGFECSMVAFRVA